MQYETEIHYKSSIYVGHIRTCRCTKYLYVDRLHFDRKSYIAVMTVILDCFRNIVQTSPEYYVIEIWGFQCWLLLTLNTVPFKINTFKMVIEKT